jgi:predicted metal-dependent hydrolase
MLSIWKTTSSTATPDPRFGPDARALTVVRGPRARRMRLAVDPRTGDVRLTLPPRAKLVDALAWVEQHRGWIERQLARLPTPAPIGPGATIPFGDTPLTIDWSVGRPRAIRREGNVLLVGGPVDSLAPRVLRWLKREALAVLADESGYYAGRAGVTLGRISVGDPRSRWGSCASSGDIRYSWRLILAPAYVRRATVAHEVAHRVHMNHGPAFHALVADLFGDNPAPARAWLRANGAALHWFGKTG